MGHRLLCRLSIFGWGVAESPAG